MDNESTNTPYQQIPETGSYPPANNAYVVPVQKQPKGWGKLWAALGLTVAVMLIQTIGLFIGMVSGSDDAMLTVGEIVGGVTALLFVIALGGKKLAVPSLKGMGEAWHILRWIFLVDVLIAIIDAISIFIDGSFELAQLWGLRVMILALMCAGIGLFEEATFRGLIFHGLLARMGMNYRGVFWAVIISSVVFGLMHIDPFSMNWTDPAQIAQAVLKIAQTGIFGFAAAVVVLRTQSIWPVALLHALNDFLLMVVTNGFMADPITLEYVSEGADGLMAIGVYIVLCAAYIPSIIAAWRALKELPMPNRGQFYKPRIYQSGYPAAYPTGYPATYPAAHPAMYSAGYPATYPAAHPTMYPVAHPAMYSAGYPTTYPASYPAAPSASSYSAAPLHTTPEGQL